MRTHKSIDDDEFSPRTVIGSCKSDLVPIGWVTRAEEKKKRLRSSFVNFFCCVEGDENADETLTSVSTDDKEHEPLSEEKDILDNLRPVSPKPGHIERVKAPMSPQSKRHDPREARFLKINVRHITDGQVSKTGGIRKEEGNG